MLISIFGMVWKDIHRRFDGGGLTRTNMWPSILFTTTARSKLTSRALKRDPRSIRAVAATSIRKFPEYLTSASTTSSPSTVKSLSRGFVITGAASPISICRSEIFDRNEGVLTLEIFFVILALTKFSTSVVLYRAKNTLPITALIHRVCKCSSDECNLCTSVIMSFTSYCSGIGGLYLESGLLS